MTTGTTKWRFSRVRGSQIKTNVEMAQRDKPVKMVIPSTFAQVMTFTSFLFLLFTQNRSFYELVPTGDEDYGTNIEILKSC